MKRSAANRGLLFFSLAIACVALPAAGIVWRTGQRALGTSLFLFALSLGPCLIIYALVARSGVDHSHNAGPRAA